MSHPVDLPGMNSPLRTLRTLTALTTLRTPRTLGTLRTLKTLPVIAGLLLVLTACGNGDGRASSAPSASADLLLLCVAWAKCMREHGMVVPDPMPSQGLAIPGDPGDPKVSAAMTACRSLQPAADGPADDPAARQKLAEYFKCLREHGVDVPEPDANGLQRLPDMRDEKVAAAAGACQQ